MEIDKEKCSGCEACHPYCPVEAIVTVRWNARTVSEVNQENCVECGVCLRSGICAVDAIYMPEIKWPRVLRAEFSNPLVRHSSTGAGGRGTSEMKTNDITGRIRPGFTGVAIEMGRPGLGTTFRDIQTVCVALAEMGIYLEPMNPTTALIVDKKMGKFNEEVLDERVLSAICEFTVENGRLREVLETIKNISKKIDTVCSLGLMSRVNEDGTVPVVSIAEKAGFCPRISTKTCVGLGRPLKGRFKMTHTLHRNGGIDSLKEDYVLLALTVPGVNREGSEEK